MFTGIIEAVGQVQKVAASAGGVRMTVSSMPGIFSRSSAMRSTTPSWWYGDVVSGTSLLSCAKVRSGWAAK